MHKKWWYNASYSHLSTVSLYSRFQVIMEIHFHVMEFTLGQNNAFKQETSVVNFSTAVSFIKQEKPSLINV